MTSGVQPSWVLGRRAYRDSGLLVELLTAHNGRVSAVVRGAYRKQRGGSFANIMQPFSPLMVALGGKSELKYLASAESAGVALALPGEQLFSGLYMNELLIRLLPKFDPAPMLFAEYGHSLSQLAGGEDSELTLRRFELRLFEEQGYELQWLKTEDGSSVAEEKRYHFYPDRGFRVANAQDVTVRDDSALLGSELKTLHLWQKHEAILDETLRFKLKKVMRQAVDFRLDGRPLKVREAVNEWRSLGLNKGS